MIVEWCWIAEKLQGKPMKDKNLLINLLVGLLEEAQQVKPENILGLFQHIEAFAGKNTPLPSGCDSLLFALRPNTSQPSLFIPDIAFGN